MRIVELRIKISLQVLFAVLTHVPSVLIIHLSTDHQPKIGGEDGGIEFDKAVGITVTHLETIIERPGVVASHLSKENRIILEGVGVRKYKIDVTVIVGKGFGKFRIE